MAIIRATSVLNRKSGKPEDAVRSVLHFSTAGASNDAVLSKIGGAVAKFYEDLSSWFGLSIARAATAHRVEMAVVTQGGPGALDDSVSKLVAIREFGGLFNIPNSQSLPSEVACAWSFRGSVEGVPEEDAGGLTRPASRRRGRIFIGPLVVNALDEEASSSRVRVAVGLRNAIQAAGAAMIGSVNAGPSDNARLVVYSRVSGVVHTVEQTHVDDAFDTVRSRGEKTVARSSQDVAQPALL